jgi:uncharacterized protein (UPF0548 family)
MTTESANCFVLAEMRTHHFTFQGTGEDREAARRALLNAWQAHRNRLVQITQSAATESAMKNTLNPASGSVIK